MKYLGFLHSCNQNQPWANSVLIRVLWEDIAKAKLYGYDWKKAVYGDFSDRKEERGLIYPNKEIYAEWAIISSNYKNVFLSINFDTYPKDKRQKFINFVTEVMNFFYLYNENIIVGAGNESYEKRGNIEKCIEVISDVSTGVYRTTHPLPVCFWNQKIRTSKEKEVLEKLIKTTVVREFCDYFGYQSLGTTPETARKYIQLAQSKGVTVLDVELGTTTDKPNEIETLVKNNILNDVEGIWILTPEIRNKLRKEYKIWDGYALRILDDEDENFVVVNKYKRRVINYAKQFLEKEEDEEMKLEKTYKKWSRGLPIKFIQRAINLYVDIVFVGSIDFEKLEWHPLDVDGIFGPLTEKAIKWYQEMESLEQQIGVVDERTFESLIGDSPSVWNWFCLRWAYGER